MKTELDKIIDVIGNHNNRLRHMAVVRRYIERAKDRYPLKWEELNKAYAEAELQVKRRELDLFHA